MLSISHDTISFTDENSYFSITEIEPMDPSDSYTTPVIISAQRPTTFRFKQPQYDLISTAHPHFYKMMESHSAIYSAFTYLTRKGLCYVPKNVIDPLSVKTTKTSILLQQEQKILLFINDRKEAERRTIVKEILAEPHLSDSWHERLAKMVK